MLRLEIIGNLGTDAKIIRGNNGKEFCSISVATTRKYRNKDGQDVEQTTWVTVSLNWNCQNLVPYLKKGAKVYVAGQMRTRIYKTQHEEWCCGIDLLADTLELCSTIKPDTNSNSETFDIRQ